MIDFVEQQLNAREPCSVFLTFHWLNWSSGGGIFWYLRSCCCCCDTRVGICHTFCPTGQRCRRLVGILNEWGISNNNCTNSFIYDPWWSWYKLIGPKSINPPTKYMYDGMVATVRVRLRWFLATLTLFHREVANCRNHDGGGGCGFQWCSSIVLDTF